MKSIYTAGNLEVSEAGASGALLFMVGDETEDLRTVELDETAVAQLQLALRSWLKQRIGRPKQNKREADKHGS